MTDKYYDIYFDPADLVVDRGGELENPEALHIVEFEYDDETEQITSFQRVDEKGNTISEPMEWDEVLRMSHVGDGDDDTIDAAMGRFEGWLTDNLEWRESYRGDYYNPPEYVCVGITGYVDEPPYRPLHISDTVIRAMLKRRR